jgi:hypothetical protein
MLRGFESWPDVLQYVRAGGQLYYVPEEMNGPCRTVARVRQAANGDDVCLLLRCPHDASVSYPPTVADQTFLDKLYRWEMLKTSQKQ